MHIGIDLGGTKTEIIALNHQGHECYRQRVPTVKNDYAATLKTIVDLVRDAEAVLETTATVGIGIPGALSQKSGLVKNANSTWLIGQPLKEDLEQALERKIRIANDANCFTVSEAVDGAAKGANVVFGVIIGTGTGGGIVINEQPVTGINAIAGEWGHNPLPWADENDPAMPCYCGKRGCIETYLSGPGFIRHFKALGGEADNVQQLLMQLDTGSAAQRALAEQALVLYEGRLAKGLASIINVLDPDVIVLGGGLSNIKRLYHNVPNRWSDYVFSDSVNTKLVQAMHGDSSGVRGAAWLWH